MLCCVSSGSCDSSNVGVIYRPLDKQASLPQSVNVGLTDRLQSGVWGSSGALKRLPEDPSAKWESFIWLLFHSGREWAIRGLSLSKRRTKPSQFYSTRFCAASLFKGNVHHKTRRWKTVRVIWCLGSVFTAKKHSHSSSCFCVIEPLESHFLKRSEKRSQAEVALFQLVLLVELARTHIILF